MIKLIVHGRNEIRKGVFRCDIEVDRTAPISGHTRDRYYDVFKETDNGWVRTR